MPAGGNGTQSGTASDQDAILSVVKTDPTYKDMVSYDIIAYDQGNGTATVRVQTPFDFPKEYVVYVDRNPDGYWFVFSDNMPR